MPVTTVLAIANVPYSASMYMTPNTSDPSHFHLPKESHRPMASETITVASGRTPHRKTSVKPIAPAPSVKHQNTISTSAQTARYARGAMISERRRPLVVAMGLPSFPASLPGGWLVMIP